METHSNPPDPRTRSAMAVLDLQKSLRESGLEIVGVLYPESGEGDLLRIWPVEDAPAAILGMVR